MFSKKSRQDGPLDLPHGLHPIPQESHNGPLVDSLRDLHPLLQDYAPTWYTETHSARIQSALRDEPGNIEELFEELYGLLNAYAPAWYTEEHRTKAERVMESLKNSRDSAPTENFARGAGRC